MRQRKEVMRQRYICKIWKYIRHGELFLHLTTVVVGRSKGPVVTQQETWAVPRPPNPANGTPQSHDYR
jgi:hypothetical protein